MGVVPSDGVEHLSSHFREAFTYTKNWLISFLCVSIIASIFIDDIISSGKIQRDDLTILVVDGK